MVVRQACEELSGAATALRELCVHEQFRAQVASQSRAAGAFGMCNQATVRAQYCALLRWFHTYPTVDSCRQERSATQGQKIWQWEKNVTFAEGRLDKGMFAYFKEICIGLWSFRRDW